MIAIRNDLMDELAEENPEALLADGLAEAYIRYTQNHHHPVVAVYDIDKCRQILMADGMSDEEADEYLSFNTLGAYVGPNGPLFVKLV